MESSMPLCASQLLAALSSDWSRTEEVLRRLCLSASPRRIEEALLALVYDDAVQHIPPNLWRLSPVSPVSPGSQREIHVLVDLGNVHCCLQRLVPLAREGLLTVRAYADLAYSGYGVVPPLQEPNVEVHQALTPDRNSADVELIWQLSRLSAQARADRRRLDVYVCTRDLGFQRLRVLAEQDGHRLVFVTSFVALAQTELKAILERH